MNIPAFELAECLIGEATNNNKNVTDMAVTNRSDYRLEMQETKVHNPVYPLIPLDAVSPANPARHRDGGNRRNRRKITNPLEKT